VKIAEVPPGPPALQTLVAEIYGPTGQQRFETARRVRDIFKATDGMVGVDWYLQTDQPKKVFAIDHEKAAVIH
jgi:hypothetical protein